jgi:hypothetical protein
MPNESQHYVLRLILEDGECNCFCYLIKQVEDSPKNQTPAKIENPNLPTKSKEGPSPLIEDDIIATAPPDSNGDQVELVKYQSLDSQRRSLINQSEWVKQEDGLVLEKIMDHLVSEGNFARFLSDKCKESQQHGYIDKRTFLKFLDSSIGPDYFAQIGSDRLVVKAESREGLSDDESDSILLVTGKCVYTRSACRWIIKPADILEKSYIDFKGGWVNSFKHAGEKSAKTKFSIKILSSQKLLENFAKHTPILVFDILRELEQHAFKELDVWAKFIISENLCDFTYRLPDNYKREQNPLPSWINLLLKDITQKGQVDAVTKILVHCNGDLKSRCENLLSYLDGAGFKQFLDNYMKLHGLVVEPCSDDTGELVFLLDFMGKSPIAGIRLTDLPKGLRSDLPVLDPSEIEPIFVDTSLDAGSHLGLYYKRITMVICKISSYKMPSNKHLLVGEWQRDCTSEDMTDGRLVTLLERRAPLHERRLLQELGIPCRQSVDDAVCHRLTQMREKGERNGNAVTPYNIDLAYAEIICAYRRHAQSVADASFDELSEKVSALKQDGVGTEYLLPGMLLLKRLASSAHIPPNSELQNHIVELRKSYAAQGHYIASQLCASMLKRIERGANEESERLTCISFMLPIIKAFWNEMAKCFPDDLSEQWTQISTRQVHPRTNTGGEITPYTALILSSIFDRHNVRFYEKVRPLPREFNQWALDSITRLHLLSALIPFCCGDWACQHRHDHPRNRRRVWEWRLAALFSKRATEDNYQGGNVPHCMTGSTSTSWCGESSCKHANHDAALLSLALELTKREDHLRVYKIIGRIGWWFNSLLDIEMHNHFRCSKCGRLMMPRWTIDNFNIFDCPANDGNDHDQNIRLTWCIGGNCTNIIDSRIMNDLCTNGILICNNCGLCCFRHSKTAKDFDEKPNYACRNCSRVIGLTQNEVDGLNSEGSVIKCNGCSTNNRLFPKNTSTKSLFNADDAAMQGALLDAGFRFNTREP